MTHYLGKLVWNVADKPFQEYELAKPNITIGRKEPSDIVLNDPTVSRAHARIEMSPEGPLLTDLGSGNGTMVNGVRKAQAMLLPGDIIKLGACELEFQSMVSPGPGLSTLGKTMLESVIDYNAALGEEAMATTIADTTKDRLAICTPEGTYEIPLREGSMTIGRHPNCDIHLNMRGVSLEHAAIEYRNSGYMIRDLNSTNGTWLGEERIKEHALQGQDVIRIGKTVLVFKRGFGSDDLAFHHSLFNKGDQTRRSVVIVPGICGSELWRGSERIWPNVKMLIKEPELFSLPDKTPLEPRGILGDIVIVPNLIKLEQYGRLREFLVESLGYHLGHDLIEFTYDWRKDIREAARRLGERIESWGAKPPITIIAHSMGCLVSRYYVERLGGKNKIDRLLLVGGPHHGAPQAVSLIHSGKNFLPFGLLSDRIRRALGTFPSIYQLLPIYPCINDEKGKAINVLNNDQWVPEAQRPLITNARRFRRELGTTSSIPTVSIFGYGVKTIVKVVADCTDEGGWRDASYLSEAAGDHTVPEYSAVLDMAHIHPVQQYHGSLYVDPDVKMRLKMELTRHHFPSR